MDHGLFKGKIIKCCGVLKNIEVKYMTVTAECSDFLNYKQVL